jgi:hypothetical protein
MLIPFDDLSDNARIWIYPSNRPFSLDEVNWLSQKIGEFLTNWTAHGASLKAGFTLPYNRFIVFALDESEQTATGCSIDSSVHFIQSIEQHLEVQLLDKMNVSFKQGEFITYKTLTDFKQLVSNKSVSAETTVFNHLVLNKGEFLTQWEVPARASWHARFF